MEYVYSLNYCDQPDYDLLKKLLTNTLKNLGMKDNKNHLSWLEFSSSPATKKSPIAGTKRKVTNSVNQQKTGYDKSKFREVTFPGNIRSKGGTYLAAVSIIF